jgi:hypothetical protein
MGTFGLILLTLAAGLAVVFWRALSPAPQVEVTERGILDRRLSLGWLDWDAIEGAYRPRSTEGDRLLLRVRVNERLGRRLSRRMDKGQPLPRQLELSLDLSGTQYSEVEVLQEIMARSQTTTADLPSTLAADQTRIPCG